MRDNRGAERASEVRCDRANSPFASSRRSQRSESAPARNRQKSRSTPTPHAGPRSSGKGGSPPGHNTRYIPRPPPSSPDHLKGGKEKRQKSQGAKLPKEFPRGEKPTAQLEHSLKGKKASHDLCKSASLQKVPTAPLTKSTNITCPINGAHSPLHLVQVGWGS